MVFARSALRVARPAGSLLSQRCSTAFASRGASLARTASLGGVRTLTATSSRQGKVLLVLYDVRRCQLMRFAIFASNKTYCRAANTPPTSQSFSEPLRTSWVSGSGSRTTATLLLPLLTRRARTASSTRSFPMLRSSSPHRKSHFCS